MLEAHFCGKIGRVKGLLWKKKTSGNEKRSQKDEFIESVKTLVISSNSRDVVVSYNQYGTHINTDCNIMNKIKYYSQVSGCGGKQAGPPGPM